VLRLNSRRAGSSDSSLRSVKAFGPNRASATYTTWSWSHAHTKHSSSRRVVVRATRTDPGWPDASPVRHDSIPVPAGASRSLHAAVAAGPIFSSSCNVRRTLCPPSSHPTNRRRQLSPTLQPRVARIPASRHKAHNPPQRQASKALHGFLRMPNVGPTNAPNGAASARRPTTRGRRRPSRGMQVGLRAQRSQQVWGRHGDS
jgi:hypothetical protein